jgi:hypothetical protein
MQILIVKIGRSLEKKLGGKMVEFSDGVFVPDVRINK